MSDILRPARPAGAQVPQPRRPLPTADITRPAWNGWAICPHALTIYLDQGLGYYDIDLETLTTQDTWDWLRHLFEKNWATDAVLAGFIKAIDASLGHSVRAGYTKDARTQNIRNFAEHYATTQGRSCYQEGSG